MPTTSAPTAGAARRNPSPHGPGSEDVLRVHRQQRGRAAEQHRERSSEIAPSTCFLRQMNAKPANSDSIEIGVPLPPTGMRWIAAT